MSWSELFDKEHVPSDTQIAEFVQTPLWRDLAGYLQQTHCVQPAFSYSGCSMDGGSWRGWNVKYRKSGKVLCSLYPKQGYFVALIAVGVKEMNEAALLLPLCDEYTRGLFERTECGYNGKSLAFEVTNETVLRDVKTLIALRAAAKKTKDE